MFSCCPTRQVLTRCGILVALLSGCAVPFPDVPDLPDPPDKPVDPDPPVGCEELAGPAECAMNPDCEWYTDHDAFPGPISRCRGR